MLPVIIYRKCSNSGLLRYLNLRPFAFSRPAFLTARQTSCHRYPISESKPDNETHQSKAGAGPVASTFAGPAVRFHDFLLTTLSCLDLGFGMDFVFLLETATRLLLCLAQLTLFPICFEPVFCYVFSILRSPPGWEPDRGGAFQGGFTCSRCFALFLYTIQVWFTDTVCMNSSR